MWRSSIAEERNRDKVSGMADTTILAIKKGYFIF